MQEVEEKIWKSESDMPGKTLIISGGVHGNERTGIEVILRIRDALEQGLLEHVSGTLFLFLGNLKAIEMNERWSDSGVDLNRCFGVITEHIRDSYEDRRATQIKSILAIERQVSGTVIGIDIHATNKPSKPFLVLQPTPADLHTALFTHIRGAQAILYDPDWVFTGTPATCDDYYNMNGNTGFCYETGCADDLSRVEEVYDEIVSLAQSQNVLRKKDGVIAQQIVRAQELPSYALRHAIILTDQGFSYASGMGIATFQEFSKGSLLGHHGSTPLIANFNGVFIFPKLPKHWKLGEPVGFLAEKVEPIK